MEQTVKAPTKDELIVRQSQLQRAIELYTLIGQRPTIQEVCRLSQILTEFIFTWDLKSKGMKDFDNHIIEQFKKDLITDLTKINKKRLINILNCGVTFLYLLLVEGWFLNYDIAIL